MVRETWKAAEGCTSATPILPLPMSKPNHLTAPDGSTYEIETPGEPGRYRKEKTYGRLDCSSAIRAPPKDYARHRVIAPVSTTFSVVLGCSVCSNASGVNG